MNHVGAERVADWRPASDWVAESGGRIFKTKSSFEWFVRTHRAELESSGQYIIRRGPCGAMVGPDIDTVILEILRGASRLESPT